jgi:hypothetical protein
MRSHYRPTGALSAALLVFALVLAGCPEPLDVTSMPFRCHTSVHCLAGMVCHPEYEVCAPPGWPYVDAVSGSNGDAESSSSAKRCTFNSDCDDQPESDCAFWSCQSSSGRCVEVVKNDKCRIDGQCYSNGDTLSGDECKRCFADSSPTEWISTICPSSKTCNPESGLCESEGR